jgi:hypothetical protein
VIPRGAVVICSSDDRLLTNCHDAPVFVVIGETRGTKDNWSTAIDRYCTTCEGKVDPKRDCHRGPGTAFARRVARSRPEGA